MPIYQLNEEPFFPDPKDAEEGIVAVGGDLTPLRLLEAYRSGIFPWFSEDDPIFWWSPDPRYIVFPSEVKVSKSMRKVLRDQTFTITYNKDFNSVINACALIPRNGQEGTWITEEMEDAYVRLHQLGFVQSVEVWQDEQLVGGLYGVVLGKCFFGESMFATVSNASKAGFITLAQRLEELNFQLIDCQIETEHLKSLGSKPISRDLFLDILKENKALESDTIWL